MKNYFFSIYRRPSFHIPVIDGVRAVSVLLVLVGHLFHFHSSLFTLREETDFLSTFFGFFRADLAVDMFFVISGFLIGTILFKEYKKTSKISYKTFFLKRFFRLMPVYYFSLFLTWLRYNIASSDGGNLEISLMMNNYWYNVFYINNFLEVNLQFMGWCWSLAVEEQFYFVIPFFIVFLLRKIKSKTSVFIFLLILSSVIRFFVVYQNNLVGDNFWGGGLDENLDYWRKTFSLLYDNLYTRFGSLFVGVFASFLTIYKKEQTLSFFKENRFVKKGFYVSVLVFVIVFLKVDYLYFSEFTSHGLKISYPFLSEIEKIYFSFIVSVSRNLFSLSVMCLILYCLYNPDGIKSRLNRFLSSRFLFPVAQLSYSAYLIHPLVMLPVFRYSTPFLFESFTNVYVVFFINSLFSIIIIYLFSILLYLFIEKPFMEMRKSSLFKKVRG